MTSVDVSLQSFEATFFSTWLFSQIPEEIRKSIASQLQLCAFRPGAVIQSSSELPASVHCVVQGRVRVLGSSAYQYSTLEVGKTGTIVGWDHLLRRVSCGAVRAAMQLESEAEDQEVLTLALPADAFETLALQYLMPTLRDRISSLELFDTLTRFLASLPTRSSEINPKDLVHSVAQHHLAIVQHLFPESFQSASRSNSRESDLLSADRLWLLSGGEHLSVPPGTVIHSMRELYADNNARFPFRLLGIDREFLSSVMLQGQIPAVSSVSSESEAPPSVSDRFSSNDSLTFSLANSSANVETPELSFSQPSPDYPIWRSPLADPIEDVVACLGMICTWFRVPYRPDFLRQWLKRRSLEDWEGLDICLRTAEAIGFQGEEVSFTPSVGGLNRLPVPCLIECQDILVVLYDVTPTTAIVASPRTGLLRLKTEELAFRSGQNRVTYPATAEVIRGTAIRETAIRETRRAIVLSRLANTPTKQFGFQWFVPVLLTQRGILLQVLVASLFIQLLNLANPLLVQQVIDSVIVGANPNAMTMFGILMLLCAFFEGGLSILRMYLFASTANRVDLHLGIEIVRHLLHLPLPFFEQRPVGELAARLSELENIRQFLTSTALTVVLDVIFSLFYIAVMFLYSSRLAWCVLLTIPIIVISTLLVAAIQKKLIRVKSDRHAKVQSYLVEVLSGIFTVKAQHIEPLVEATWRDRYVQYLGSGFKTVTVGTLFSSFHSFLNTVSSLLVLWVGADLVLKGELTLGGLIAFRILAGYVTAPLLRLASLWQRFQETSLSMELLAEIADFPTEEPPDTAVRLQMPLLQGRVEYNDVSFAFRTGSSQVSPQLRNVHLNIAPGSFVGIVGQSGSGKSTLMKLLPRLYNPQSGRIYLDGYDIHKVSLDSLRQQIGIVPQDAVLFEGTIRDNIALFEPLSDEAVIEAATIAEAHDFIMQLPEGYSTAVGERGGSLSGGQRQRIAIARVVARSPRLLIFDEATSALDYETEKRVCENLMRYFRDRTCFFITHRLNTIANADRILLMQSGTIVEQGTHQQLMDDRQLYYCLYQQQSRS